jgi:hypothetical protein
MITLGIVQLVTTAATMFHHFFGGEGGVKTDREIGISLFGLAYGQSIQVYYLIVAWMMISAVGMYFHTMTPLGRMANACRDNHERAQFVGYDPRIVRWFRYLRPQRLPPFSARPLRPQRRRLNRFRRLLPLRPAARFRRSPSRTFRNGRERHRP